MIYMLGFKGLNGSVINVENNADSILTGLQLCRIYMCQKDHGDYELKQ